MLRTLILIASASATAGCALLPPPPPFLAPGDITIRATVESLSEVDPAGYCAPGAADCRVYLINLVERSRAPVCPFLAVNYRDDNGRRYVVWPETLIGARDQRWNLVARRHSTPRCFYALVNATLDPR